MRYYLNVHFQGQRVKIHFRILSVRYPKFHDRALSIVNTLAQLKPRN